MRALLSCLTVSLAFVAIPVSAERPRTSEGDIAAIREAGKQWARLYDAGRFAEIPDLYTVDTMVMPRGRPRIEGREAMRRAIGGLAAGRHVDIVVTEREIRSIGDYGWYIGDFRVTYTPKTPGAAATSEVGRSLIIYRRDDDGKWRVHRDIDSPAPLAVATSSATIGPVKLAAVAGSFEQPALWDPATRTVAVACDRLSASRYDRTRLSPGVARADINVPVAIAACEADLAQWPGDPRILFQLGRLYGYAADAAKTLAARRAAAAAGNHNAIFLLGYLDWQSAKDDAARCTAGARMRLAADRGNYSAQVTIASYLLEGKFAACAERPSYAQATGYVEAARRAADGFFETRFVEDLAVRLAKAAAARGRLTSQMAGTWTGTFRRYDAEGRLIETLPSEIRIAFDVGGQDYRQTNVLRRPDGTIEQIETTGRWNGDRLLFQNARVEGWFGPLADDPTGLSSVLQLMFKGAQPMTMSEVLTVSPDGTRRMRVAQYVADGKVVRRTLIDEVRKDAPKPD